MEALKRQHIVNDETRLVTAESFLRSGVDPELSTRRIVHRHEGGGDVLAARPGTPNGRAGPYLAIDHGEEMGIINVDRIEHYKEDDKEHLHLFHLGLRLAAPDSTLADSWEPRTACRVQRA